MLESYLKLSLFWWNPSANDQMSLNIAQKLYENISV